MKRTHVVEALRHQLSTANWESDTTPITLASTPDTESIPAKTGPGDAQSSPQPFDSERYFSTGCRHWDASLPDSSFRRGILAEWFSDQRGSGAELLSLWIARQACQAGGHLAVIDHSGWFYPPAAAAWGVDLRRLICIRPQKPSDALWAFDQALRCKAVKAVWGHLDHFNDRWFRRFQLAARSSGAVGLFLRSSQYQKRPSWADLQLSVERLAPQQLRLTLLRAPALLAPKTLAVTLQPGRQKLSTA